MQELIVIQIILQFDRNLNARFLKNSAIKDTVGCCAKKEKQSEPACLSGVVKLPKVEKLLDI